MQTGIKMFSAGNKKCWSAAAAAKIKNMDLNKKIGQYCKRHDNGKTMT